MRFSKDLKKAIDKLGYDKKLVTNPDLSNDKDNKKREEIFKIHRGFFNDAMDKLSWQLVELDQDDVKGLLYTDWEHWKLMTGYTRLVGVGTKNIKRGIEAGVIENKKYYEIAKDIENGKIHRPIVVIEHKVDGQQVALEVIEGHLRCTGYALADNPPKPLMAYIGLVK